MSSERRIDRKGRVTIPKKLRERLGLDPGEAVSVRLEDGDLVIRPQVRREDAVETLRGCVNAETRREDAAELAPGDLKRDWTADLP